MANLDLSSIGSLLSGGGVSAIARRLKLKNDDVTKVLAAGIPTLLTGLKRNTGSEGGERSLCLAAADHGGTDLSDLGAFLKTADLKDGKKVLKHALGSDQDALISEIAERSGVTRAKTSSVLAIVGILLLVLLGKQQNQSGGSSGFSMGGLLGGLLSGGQQTQQTSLLGGLFGSQQPQQSQQSGLLSLFGGSQQSQPAQQEQSGGLLNSFLNLFR